MTKAQNKTRLIITTIVLLIALVAAGTVGILVRNNNVPAAETTQTETDSTTDTTDSEDNTVDQVDSPAVEVDPSTLTSIDIEPMAIEVFYSKGIPGFEFQVKRAADGTKYVEFSSPDLVGTKCTNDTGVFVTIIEAPSSSEDQTTIDQKVTVGDVIYGLSLASQNCTSNLALLNEYQTAFSNGFSSLKVLE